MRSSLATLVATSLLFLAGTASAQQQQQVGGQWSTSNMGMPPGPSGGGDIDNIGNEWQFVFGFERLTGVFWDSTTIEGDNTKLELDQTRVALLAAPGALGFSNAPRFAIDFFVVDGVSVGGTLAYMSVASTQGTTTAGVKSESEDSWSGFAFAPRVGYAYQIDDTFAIWPRAGIAYFSGSTEADAGNNTTVEVDMSFIDFTLDAMFVISPIENFAILVGPHVDLGLSGSYDPAVGESQDATSGGFGVSGGIVGYY